jgi:hypothetical protein
VGCLVRYIRYEHVISIDEESIVSTF